MSQEIGTGQGCIICELVRGGARVLYATRDEPLEDSDSGWQFLCGSEDHGDGSEQGVVSCLDAIVEHEPRLAMFLDQPVGAVLERASPIHAFERKDVAMPDGSFVCDFCQETHEGLPMDWAVDSPYYFDEGDADRWTLGDRTAVWRAEDATHYFYQARLELPVVDGPCAFRLSAWVSVAEKNFPAVQHLLAHGAEDEIAAPFFGWLSNRLPYFPDTVNLESNVYFVPGADAPLIDLKPTEHPLSLAQHSGMTLAHVHELIDVSEAW